MKVLAPAKINLGLEIIGKRDDGYHNVDMIMQTIDIYDAITINESEKSGINFKCIPSASRNDESNTGYKAAEEFFKYTGIKNFKVDIFIEKRIPICAGLGGGSSDAAAVIVGLDNFFKTELKDTEIMNIGKKLGADVPFCIVGGTMRAQGIGTDLSKLNSLPECSIVIVKPDFSVSTKKAYENLGEIKYSDDKRIQAIISGLDNGKIDEVGKALFNRFTESEKISKDINLIINRLQDLGALGACMSGSGSSVFGIFKEHNIALNALDTIKQDYKTAFVCKPVSHGAKIV